MNRRLRFWTKILCWLDLLAPALGFLIALGGALLLPPAWSRELNGWLLAGWLAIIILVALFGSWDVFNRPRSIFTLVVTIINFGLLALLLMLTLLVGVVSLLALLTSGWH